MRKSKLENYEDILSVLMDRYLSVDSLSYECKMDCQAAKNRLDFLIENKLVEKHQVNKKMLYTLTTRGEAICKTLMLTQRLNKLKKTIKIASHTLHEIPAAKEQNHQNAKQHMKDENY